MASQANILLVDDHEANLLALEVVLQPLGQELIKARSGEEALQLLHQKDFAVVLLDIRLGGMDGFEVAQRIRAQERSKHTPIIFVTAFESEDFSPTKAYTLGAVDYLVKPLVPIILRAKVEVFLALFQRAEQVRQLERHRSENEALHRFRVILEHSWDALALIGPDAIIRYASPSTVRILGYPLEEFVGHNLFEFMHPDDTARIQRLFAQLMAQPGGVITSSYRYRHKDGRWRWLEASSTNLLTDPSVQAIVGNYRDITEHREAEEELRRHAQELAEAHQQKDQFLAMLAHELRNPLAPLRTGIHVLRQPQTPPEIRERTRDMMERQLRHLSRMVDDLLEVSRVLRGKVQLRQERLDLRQVARTAAEDRRSVLEQAGLTLVLDVPDAPVCVTGDPTRLTQILNNLLDNSLKFAKGRHGVFVRVEADQEERQAVLSVRDEGIGIEPESLPQVFMPFWQADRSLDRSRGGLGLGLPMVKGLAELHGGSVEAFSEGVGRGAEFTVRLPLSQEPPALTETLAVPQAAEKRLRVLVIEDNRDAADSLHLLLSLLGHEAQVAYSGPEGVTAAKEWRPHVVLCDVGLPGMDGYEVARQLRQLPGMAKTIVAAITGYGQDSDVQRSKEAGIDYHFLKPIEPAKLKQLLANAGKS